MKSVCFSTYKYIVFAFGIFVLITFLSPLFADFPLSDEFNSDLISNGWKVKAGKWKISNGLLLQYQDNAPNANLYKKLYQTGNLFYEYKLTFQQGSSAGIHIFASDIYYPERGDSYLIWQDNEGIKVYETTEAGGLGAIIDQNNNFPGESGATYTYKIWYSVSQRRLLVIRDNYLVVDTLLPFPLKTGRYISFRARNSVVKFDYLKIKKFSKFPPRNEFEKMQKNDKSNVGNKITKTEIIVRTDTLKTVEDAKEFVNMMVKANIKRVAVAFKDDETGKFHVQVPDAPYIKVMPGYEDEQVVRTLIREAHNNNIKIIAWIMTFRDPELVKQRPDLVMMRKVGNKIVPNISWVSPINPEVQDRMFKIWKSVLTRFKVDGVRIDHIRFDEDWEDFSPMMRKAMKEKFNVDIMKMKPNTDEWIKWVDFRADIIVNFLKKLTKMMKEVRPDLDDIAMYALPFSAQYGSYHEWTGTGQDFAKLSKIPNFKIFVMAYWEDFCDGEGAEPVRNWLNDVIGNSYKLAGNTIIPTFSVTDWASAWNRSLSNSEFDMYDRICREVSLKYGYDFIAYFYYWKWGLSQMKKAGVDK